ncbi:penicillin-binding transpeptidase domain-containing protein [Bartonella tamiae]|uniref:Beta-lactamase n=1 Tax=Bartonella tamiae Th239 TaxID=1094558 RepID=J0ZPL9_9HYPH|nr:penicillin-binding transpeptidase domain-containing protein [Bartonella tamiae]EJF90533.1 hypothetical protein ME5_00934 [Bartonella tamiae Th239]EJF93523.1 hypothetical protein MEG_00947 [Bartonella tamiae Th307]
MKHIFYICPFLCCLFYSSSSLADCILLKNINAVAPFFQSGDCNERAPAASTFKIPLAIIGYEAGILKDENTPKWPYDVSYNASLNIWKKAQTPKSWIRHSVVWYSQHLTEKIGKQTLQDQLERFDYGNKDISDKNGENGLQRAWLNGTLSLSPQEQLRFLSNVASGHYSQTSNEQKFLKNIFRIDQSFHGWTVYAKTGATGFRKQTTDNVPHRIAWFVGWMENEKDVIVFVNFGKQMDVHRDLTGAILKKRFFKNLPYYMSKFPGTSQNNK